LPAGLVRVSSQARMSEDTEKPDQTVPHGHSLQALNERLQLLLKLTTSITSNLTLKEVLHTVASNVREVMHCDAANIALPATEPGTFRLHALHFPGNKGLFTEEQIIIPTDDSPPKRALATLKPVSGPVTSTRAAAEGLKMACFIPLVNHGRALGYMSLARATEDAFTEQDVEFLRQAAGTIANRYRKCSGLRRDFATER
jgi:formate hydrogenlyase transcriptional activator